MATVYHSQLPLFPSKECTHCHTEKSLIDGFYRARTGKDGYEGQCKECKLAIGRARNAAKPPKPPRKPIYRPHVRKEERRQQQRAGCHRYYMAHLEKERARRKIYNASHQEERKRYNTAYYMTQIVTHPERLAEKNASNQAWKKANPLKVAESRRRREARKQERTSDTVDYDAILKRDGMWCHICEQDILLHHELHFDHVIPLDRDGSHTEDNIKPSHAICNTRKGTHLLSEMTPYQRRGPA